MSCGLVCECVLSGVRVCVCVHVSGAWCGTRYGLCCVFWVCAMQCAVCRVCVHFYVSVVCVNDARDARVGTCVSGCVCVCMCVLCVKVLARMWVGLSVSCVVCCLLYVMYCVVYGVWRVVNGVCGR